MTLSALVVKMICDSKVCFESLSVNRIEPFWSFVSENFIENITSGIWRQICVRFILESKQNGLALLFVKSSFFPIHRNHLKGLSHISPVTLAETFTAKESRVGLLLQ